MSIASVDSDFVEQLLKPVSDENPAGAELDLNSFGSPLVEVQTHRDEAERNEILKRLEKRGQNIDSQGEVITPGKVDWKIVLVSATDILNNHSKDLRAAAWMCEALLRERGIAGLVDGLAVCHGLCTTYWDQVHPRPTEADGHSIAMSGIIKLFASENIEFLRDLPFADTGVSAERPGRRVVYSFAQQRLASEFDQLDEDRQTERRAMGGISTDEFNSAIERTDPTQLTRLHRHLEDAVENLNILGNLLRQSCLPDVDDEPTAPDYVAFRTELEAMRSAVASVVGTPSGSAQDGEESANGEAAGTAVMVAGNSGVTVVSGTRLSTREDAFRLIAQIAEYFEKQEPQSPIHLGLRQIVRWGKMSFPQLMMELLEDEQMVQLLGKRVGFKHEESE